MNPKVIIEVLSSSAEAVDRGEKFDAYREIPTFEQYLLERVVNFEQFQRVVRGWQGSLIPATLQMKNGRSWHRT
jgi:Uma2 family endonuclease